MRNRVKCMNQLIIFCLDLLFPVCVCVSLTFTYTNLACISISYYFSLVVCFVSICVCVCALLISVKYGMIAYFLAIVWISMMKYEICICREAETYINIFV